MQSARWLVADTHRIQIGVNELKATLGFRRLGHRYIVDPGNQRVFLGVKVRGLPVPRPQRHRPTAYGDWRHEGIAIQDMRQIAFYGRPNDLPLERAKGLVIPVEKVLTRRALKSAVRRIA